MYIYIYIFIYILQSNFQLKYKNTGILARNITKLTGFFFKTDDSISPWTIDKWWE